jgi:aspartyl protease family protein
MNEGPWGKPPLRRQASRLGLMVWLLLLAGVGMALWALSRTFPEQDSPLQNPYLWRLVAVLAVAASGLLFIRHTNLKQASRNILAWMGVAGVLIVGFAYQEELRRIVLRVRSDIIPGYPVETAQHEMTISESANGGYFVYGSISGKPVKFLVDTGASDIVLSPSDARRVGIDVATLNFDHSYETANGVGQGARLTLPSLKVGQVEMSDVDVSVDKTEMSSSLLGMTFLRRLKSFGFGNRQLILRW